jgi:hypothetical protein
MLAQVHLGVASPPKELDQLIVTELLPNKILHMLETLF